MARAEQIRRPAVDVKDEIRGRPCRDDGPVRCCYGATLPKKSGPFREFVKAPATFRPSCRAELVRSAEGAQ